MARIAPAPVGPGYRPAAALGTVLAGLFLLAGCTAEAAAPPVDSQAGSVAPPAPATTAPGVVPAAALDATNTGWRPTGVRLTPVDCGPSGELVIDTDGATLDSKLIPCSVTVVADDVTITRSEIRSSGHFGIKKSDDVGRLTVSDTEIVGSPGCDVGVGFSGLTLTRLNVHGCADGVRPETGSVLEHSWIHDLSAARGADGSEPHNDGVQTTGGSDITIRYNKIENPHRQTSAILIGGEFGEPSNITIVGNYLDGGNFTVYLDPHGENRVIQDNVFTRRFVFGPADVSGSVEWSGNVFAEGGPVAR